MDGNKHENTKSLMLKLLPLARNNKSFELRELLRDINICDYISENRNFILHIAYNAFLDNNDFDNARKFLEMYKYANVNDEVVHSSFRYLQMIKETGKTIVCTGDLFREQTDENEIIIYFGNFCLDHNNLPWSNKIYLHPRFFENVPFDIFESHECWNAIDKIYIMNLRERADRWFSVLVTLCTMQADLRKIFHYFPEQASYTGNKELDLYINVSYTHHNCVNDMAENNYDTCLFLEDDFVFTSNIVKHQSDLLEFFKRKYDYTVCYLASSAQHEINECDDLMRISRQVCTTGAAYMLNRGSAVKIRDTMAEGITEMENGGDANIYCCDRYWFKHMSDNSFLVFSTKMGFQTPSYSNTVNRVNMNFD